MQTRHKMITFLKKEQEKLRQLIKALERKKEPEILLNVGGANLQ